MEQETRYPPYQSRAEHYLAYLIGESSDYPPHPQSRVECYLQYLCEHGGGGGGGSLKFWKLHTVYTNNRWVIVDESGNSQTFSTIREHFQNPENFVYLVHTNVVMIPAFLESQGMEFTGTYKLNGQVHHVRVIINESNEIHTDDDGLERTDLKVYDLTDWDPDDPDLEDAYPTVNAILAYIYKNSVTDVQVDGESVVNNGTANIPVLGNDINSYKWTYGVPRFFAGYCYGFSSFQSQGKSSLKIVSASSMGVNNRTVQGINGYGVIDTTNFDSAVKAAMCDGKGAAWTADEQAAAQQRIGILSVEEVLF